MTKYSLALIGILLAAGCSSHQAKVVLPTESIEAINWQQHDLQKEIAIKHIHRTATSSTHIIRLNGAEKPHYHDHHDLTVTILSGKSRIHFENRIVELNPGDVLVIPKGSYHWAEKVGDQASEVLAIFSPAFDGKDRRPAH